MTLDTRETLQSIAPSHLAAAALSGSPIVKALGMWLEYAPEENRYRELTNDELKHMVWVALEGRTYIHRGKDGDEEKTLNLNTKISADVREALIHLALETGIEELPFWRDQRDDDPDPRYLLPVSNGLLDWKTGELIAPTPRFVSTDCSQVAYDPDAVTFMWDFFLDEIFDGDLEQIELLHEVMGCILTGQIRFQKIFQLFGPARSGKGTINLMLTRLLGMRSVASPRIKQIGEGGGFGTSSLVGKKAAIIGDARLGRGRQTDALTELLLSTSGGDLQTIQRKFKDDYIGYLRIQWMLMSNEPILMHDMTGTIATRMVLMETRRSFLGREDNGLFERDLLPEASGVLNRCLEAARRLSKRGHFLVPSSIRNRMSEILREASTVAAFASECLIEDPSAATPKHDIYDAFERYCRGHGRISADKNVFWRDLRTSGKFRDDMIKRVRVDGGRVQTVNGLSVSLDEDALPVDPADDFHD